MRATDFLAAVLFAGILVCWAEGYWPVALAESGAFLLAGIWVVRITAARRPPPTGFGVLPIAGVALWGWLQLAAGRTEYRFETGKAALYWAAVASVFFAARDACARTPDRNRFLRAVLWFGSAVSLVAVVQYFTSEGRVFWLFPAPGDHALGPFLYKNECAAFIELVFPLAVYQSLVDRRQSTLYIAMAATMFAAVVAAVSRAGAVIVMCELIVMLLLARFRRPIPRARLRRTSLRLAALSLALAAVVGWQVTLGKFREPEPYRVRGELLEASLDMIAERPWMGFGLGTWPGVYPAYARFDNGLVANHAHNDWAEWAAEGGVPFAALLAMLAVWSIRPAIDSLWGIGVPAVFAHSLVDYPLREPALALLVFAMLGALAARGDVGRNRST